MNQELLRDGFTIIKNFFTEEEVNYFRKSSLQYFSSNGGFLDSSGRAKPDWIKEESLLPLYQKWNSKKIEKTIESYIGENVEFIGHNDLHINRNAGWHKDRLNGEARKFELNSPWDVVSDQSMKIYKVNFYMQSHKNNQDGLTVIKKSHHHSDMGSLRDAITLHPDLGDIVIFDQRITHMGKWSGGYDRILLCMGYGVKNIFFEQFKKGTEYRQNKQNEIKNK